jgi:hypothetical protein
MQLAALALVAVALGTSIAAYRLGNQERGLCRAGASSMARLELLFGSSRKGAADVSQAEWQSFLDAEVTPRFADGLTVLTGYGQWRNDVGTIAKETSKVLVIWHKPAADSEARIEAIRAAYKTRFAQESVMRVDSLSCVSFSG